MLIYDTSSILTECMADGIHSNDGGLEGCKRFVMAASE